MTRTYVEMLFPGVFFPESQTRSVETRDPAAVNAPDGCYCFRFYDREEMPAANGVEMLTGQPKNWSGRFYVGGAIHATDDLLAAFPEGDEIHRMARTSKLNGWNRLIKCRTGNWQPFE